MSSLHRDILEILAVESPGGFTKQADELEKFVNDYISERTRDNPRFSVYEAIESERDYQDRRWGNTLSGDREPGEYDRGGDRTVDEFILYIAGYTNDLVQNASHFADTDVKLDIIRKVTALGVAAMEQHGAPKRLIPIELRNKADLEGLVRS